MIAVSHLRALQALDLATRCGSLKEAGKILGITPAAVGQRIKSLEDYLGMELVVRSRTGLRPTGELAPALPHLAKAFGELGMAAQLLDFQRADEIHIAANSDWVDLWLMPRLPEFRTAFPNILFCINGVGDVPVRFGRADIEVTFGKCREQENIDLFYQDYLAPIGSLQNTRRIKKLATKDDLEGFPLLHLDFYKEDPDAITWPDWIEAHGHRRTAFTRGIRYRSVAPGLQAVSSNAGFMICGLALISDQIDKGELTLPFGVTKGAWTGHAFHARYRSDAAVRSPIRNFREWLVTESRKTRNWIEGFVAGK